MKKIYLISPIITILIALIATILFFFFNQNVFDRNVYLEGFDTKINQKQNKDIASFVTDPYDNYAIYKPNNSKTNNINEAEFYGNIDTYDYAPVQDYKMSMWNNDYKCFQWVIKTNYDFKKLSVDASSDNFNIKNDKDIKVEYGFSEFVYASGNGNNQYVIKQNLLVPEKITNNKTINNIKKNKVYVIFFRIKTVKTDKNMATLNLTINGIEGNNKIFSDKKKAIINIKTNNVVNNDNSDLDLFYYPEWTSYYYNNQSISNFTDEEGIKYNIPDDYKKWFSKNNYNTKGDGLTDKQKYTYNYKSYIDYNYSKYWKNDFEYVTKNYDSDWFQLNVSDCNNGHYNNIDYNNTAEACNPWKFYRKNMNFLNWKYTGDVENIKFFTSKNVDRDYFVKNCISKLKISDTSWDAFDYYLTKCYNSGLRKAMLNSIQKSTNKYDYGLDILNGNSFFHSFSSVESMQGQEFLKWWLKEFENHIDKEKNNSNLKEVYSNIKFYYYLDEKDHNSLVITNKIFKENVSKKYINLATAVPNTYINYNNVSDYDQYDYIWLYMLDCYNGNNEKLSYFTSKRKDSNLHTGQYSLDSDYTFNLVRSEPGTNMYIYEALTNQGSDNMGGGNQYYLKYLTNGWYSGQNYYTSDFYDLEWIDEDYKSGDTLFSYPECDINIQSNYNAVHNYEENENKLRATSFVPSIRYEMLSSGRKLASKTSQLLKEGKITNAYLSSNISPTNKFSRKLSNNKFDLNYKKTSFSKKEIKSSSFILRLINNNKRDEITALKNITNYIDSI